MHLLIPHAAPHSERGTDALRGLKLPNLTQLLARLSADTRLGVDEYTLSPPHEQAHAHALGWAAADGAYPWAARQASKDGIDVGDRPWGQLTPVHWHVGHDHISLPDPQTLHLSAQESHTFYEAVKPLFESEGWQMAWGGPMRWYAAHDSLDGLPCASLDRVIGRNIDLWLPTSPQARLIRRLQNEVQMLLYQLPLNDRRVEQGALPVNSFWLSGCGRRQAEHAPDGLQLLDTLRGPALAGDWAAWSTAWRELDAGPIKAALHAAQAGAPVTLTLCGERHAQQLVPSTRGLLARLGKRLSPPSPLPLLESL